MNIPLDNMYYCAIICIMSEINTNYNQPVPAEHVRGQSVAGPETKKPETETKEAKTENNTQAENNNQQENNQKGTQVNEYA